MEILLWVVVWPLLALTLGIVFVSLHDLNALFLWPAAAILIISMFGLREHFGVPNPAKTDKIKLDEMRRSVVSFSIGLLFPIFIKYLLESSNTSLISFIISILLAFGVLVWGMFIRNHKVIKYANILGGAISVIYLYSELWSLGQLAQVVGAAVGLLVAVTISILKFKDKLA